MPSKIEVISKAFTLLGAAPINSLIVNPQAAAASALYDSHYLSTLVSEEWRFAVRVFQLNELITPPDIDVYTHAYQMPSDLIRLMRLIPNGDFTIVDKQIWTNLNEPLQVEYIKNVDPGEWPVYFTTLMEFKMAWLIAPMVTQNVDTTEYWGKIFEAELLKGRYLDSQQHPNRVIQKNRFWASHFIGGSSRR